MKKFNKKQQVEYYYSCVFNSLVLFAMSFDDLMKMKSPAFSPMFELETEYDDGFNDYVLNQNFENKKINPALKPNIDSFKLKVENLKKGFWKLEFVKSHPQWEEIRMVANNLLNKMGEKRRNYDSGFTAIVVAD